MKKFLLFAMLVFSVSVVAQYIPEHQDYTNIYDLIDELANEGVIDVNSVVKPYSREFIAQSLKEARRGSRLPTRLKKEIEFYINEYSLEMNTMPQNSILPLVENSQTYHIALIEPAFRYNDNNFRAKIAPIAGAKAYHNSNGFVYKHWVGAEFQGMYGKNLSFYASIRDVVQPDNLLSNREHFDVYTKSPFTGVDTSIVQAGYINNEMGGAYKLNGVSGGDYSEMRGGVYFSGKWGHLGIAKDHITFGDAYNGSNIISGNTPSFPFVKLNLTPVKWFELNYIHASLTSMAIDSSEYYQENTGARKYWYKRKYMAANMLTFKPVKRLALSIGNSIIYSEDNFQLAYLIPIMFYKSVDHTLTRDQSENQNSQVFVNISSRNIKHLHLYASFYIDEFSWKRIGDKQTNPISYKAGFRLNNFPLSNLGLTAEYTRNNILTYKHSISSLDYTSNGYLLGSYLGDNAEQIYVALDTKPLARLHATLSYTQSKKGNDYQYIRENVGNIISQPFMKDVVWTNNTLSFKFAYEVFSHAYITAQADMSKISASDVSGTLINGEFWSKGTDYLNMYTPKYLQGNQLTLSCGMSYGF